MRTSLSLSSFFVLAALCANGCTAPAQDAFRSEGGISPDPRGVMSGTVLYRGPRPRCDWTGSDAIIDEDRAPIRARGRVILTLFDARNPPPPEGSATSALNLLVLDAPELFGSDRAQLQRVCLPIRPVGNETGVTGSAPFTWPDLELGRSYQIRGFYDGDEDFSPFFSVRNSPTRGDVAGGAVEDPTAAIPRYVPIRFGSASENPNGQAVSGVTVSLGAVVATERPAFRYEGTGKLSSRQLLPTSADTTTADAELWEQTSSLLTLLNEDADVNAAFVAGGVGLDRADRHANQWYVRDVDVVNNATGASAPDGMADPHPVLGRTRGVKWVTPIILLTRAQTPAEVRARIPTVLLIPSVRPSLVLLGNKRAFYPSIPISIAPVGVVVLDPSRPQCRIPFVPPGNPRELYSPNDPPPAIPPDPPLPPGIPVDCQEVPSGEYTINVLHGLVSAQRAGGQACMSSGMCRPEDSVLSGIVRCMMGTCRVTESDSGTDLLGGLFSSQSWTVPNDLGGPDLFYNELARNQLDPLPDGGGMLPTMPGAGSLLLASQAPAARFFVYDTDEGNPGHMYDPASGMDVRAPECQAAVPAAGGAPVPFETIPVPAECCGAVRHLCNLPLCDLPVMPLAGRAERSRYLSMSDLDMRTGRPRCVPFAIPASCCGATPVADGGT